jgi:hypothetical protein
MSGKDVYSKVIDLDSDDDNKKQPPVQSNRGSAVTVPSPFGGPRVYQNFVVADPNIAEIYHVCPPVVDTTASTVAAPVPPTLTGLCIVVKGSSNAEFQFIKGLWQRDFGMICSSHVLNHRFDFTPNGENVLGASGKGPWPLRCLIWLQDAAATTFTREQCIQVFDNWISISVARNSMFTRLKPVLPS